MKKMMFMSLLMMIMVFMSGCSLFLGIDIDDPDNTSDDLEDIINVLEEEEYVLESYDADSRTYFAGTILNDYDLTVEVVVLYQGYINTTERFVRLVQFQNSTQATNYYNAFMAVLDEGSEYLYRQGAVVLYTVSVETYNLFSS